MRNFRFGVQHCFVSSRQQLVDQVKRAEGDGYSALFTPDHFQGINLAANVMLAAAAQHSSRLQLSALVNSNDFRHPLVLAREVASLDVVSDGRAVCGLGAGWHEAEYKAVGLPWDSAGKRVSRLEEAVKVIKSAWKGDTFSHHGEFYQIADYAGIPKPLQQPGPPLLMGGGGKRVLSLAGREANIVNLIAKLDKGMGPDMNRFTDSLLDEMLGHVKAGAGERFEQLELSTLVFNAKVCDNPLQEAAKGAAEMGLTAQEALTAPAFLYGGLGQVKERLHYLRERFGLSFFIFSDWGCDLPSLAPVVAELTGT